MDRIYISTKTIAEALGWTTERARSWLIRGNAAFQVGSRWYTTRDRLLAAFPEILEALPPNPETDPEDD